MPSIFSRPPNDTLLVIIPVSGAQFTLPPAAARGLSQTLEPITGSSGGGAVLGTWVRRDINGNLVDLTKPQFRKYQSVITCKDVEAPALDDAWLGQELIVDCVPELSFVTGIGSPARTVVLGSERTQGHYTFYRPRLQMLVVGIEHGIDEYKADYNWRLQLQEV